MSCGSTMRRPCLLNLRVSGFIFSTYFVCQSGFGTCGISLCVTGELGHQSITSALEQCLDISFRLYITCMLNIVSPVQHLNSVSGPQAAWLIVNQQTRDWKFSKPASSICQFVHYFTKYWKFIFSLNCKWIVGVITLGMVSRESGKQCLRLDIVLLFLVISLHLCSQYAFVRLRLAIPIAISVHVVRIGV